MQLLIKGARHNFSHCVCFVDLGVYQFDKNIV